MPSRRLTLTPSKLLIAFVSLFPLLQACSVGMALSGEEQPNLGAIRAGSTRGGVEVHLGNSVQATSYPDGSRVDVYEYQLATNLAVEGQ